MSTKVVSILIVDDNIEFGDLLKDYLKREPDMDVVGIARDGLQGVEMIQNLSPQIVILDIIMPKLDGIAVLETVNGLNLKRKPQFLMLSAVGQDIFIQKAMVLGAEYYILKPFKMEVLASRIRSMISDLKAESMRNWASKEVTSVKAESANNFDIEVAVTNLIRDAGISAHMKGYQFVREAIILAVGNDNFSGSVTTVLYPSIAAKFDTTPKKVERAIRNAIESAWIKAINTGNEDFLTGILRCDRGKPSNSEFIASLTDLIKLKMKRFGK